MYSFLAVSDYFDVGLVSVFMWNTNRNKLCVCGPASVLLQHPESVKWPSAERTSPLPITPLPVMMSDSGQCAKQLWKRPHAFSLIECPFRNVFPALPIFIRSRETSTHFCHVRLVSLQVWHDEAHLDCVWVGHPVEIERTGMSLLNR